MKAMKPQIKENHHTEKAPRYIIIKLFQTFDKENFKTTRGEK